MGIVVNGTLNVGSGTLTNSGGIEGTGAVNFGTGKVKVAKDADIDGLTITAGTGTLELNGTGAQAVSVLSAQSLPKIKSRCSDTVTFTVDSTSFNAVGLSIGNGGTSSLTVDTINVTDFDVQKGSTFTFKSGAQAINATNTGLSGTISNLEGTTFTGTTFYADTTAVDASSTWTVDASGEAKIFGSVTVDNLVASDVAVICPDGQTDGGNNTNVTFNTFVGPEFKVHSLREEDYFQNTDDTLSAVIWQSVSVNHAFNVYEINIDSAGWQPILSTGGFGAVDSGNLLTTHYQQVRPVPASDSVRLTSLFNSGLTTGESVSFRTRGVDSDGDAIEDDWTALGSLTLSKDIDTVFLGNFVG